LPDGSGAVDDAGFILDLVDMLAADQAIDQARVYVTGISRGALLTWTLACQASDRIAAAAPIAAPMIERQAEQCHPARNVPLLVIAGSDDWIMAYDGWIRPDFRLMSVPETLEFWRKRRGCTGEVIAAAPRQPDVRDPTRAVLVSWTGCADPSPQRYWRIQGGGHTVPSFAPLSDDERTPSRFGRRSQQIETAEELWRFFAAASK